MRKGERERERERERARNRKRTDRGECIDDGWMDRKKEENDSSRGGGGGSIGENLMFQQPCGTRFTSLVILIC
jgi:hypothetical protein